MEKRIRKFTITTTPGCGGLGYTRIKDETYYIHTFMLFMFIIMFPTPIKIGKRQTAKQISNRCVQINGKLFDVKYYTDINQLNCIWYRNRLGTFIKVKDFFNYKEGFYVISSIERHKDEIITDEDVYLFHPDSKLEGYIKGNTFYATKELSVG